MSTTKIEWTDEVINFIEVRKDGSTCDPISAGCKFCFAQVFSKRLKGTKHHLYHTNNDRLKVNFDVLRKQLNKLKKSTKRVFLESMSDLFHKDIPISDVKKTLDIIKEYPQYKFMILTKRYNRLGNFLWRTTSNKLQQLLSDYELPSNVHFGISICDNKDFDRYCRDLHTATAQLDLKIFVSFEPLLEKLDINRFEVHYLGNWECDWWIVGAETGNQKRPFEEEWALDILKYARRFDIPFFFKKQHKDGEWTNKLDGKEYLELPNYE